MAPDKVTVMILNVDLKCPCCYKKVKKLLCKFPQIRDQVFDEDKNKVRITVVCCNPDKLRDKLCCKGGKAIQSIEILEDKPDPKPDPKPVVVPVPGPVQKPKPVPDPKPSPVPVVVPVPGPVQKPKPVPDPKPSPVPVVVPVPVPGPMQEHCPPAYPVPVSACCQECYQGRSGGPCHDFRYNYGRPVPPPPAPCYDGYGYGYQYPPNRPCRCDYYFSEENPQGCSVM